jgi:hypothetical protein
VLVEFLDCSLGPWSLRQRPPRHVLLLTRVGRSFGNVTSGANCARSRGLTLETSLTTSVTKGVLWFFSYLRAGLNEILGPWVSVVVNSVLHAGLSSNFRSTDSWSTTVVGNNGVV